MTSMPTVLFENVTKTYKRIKALNGVSLGISGGVTGILGPNGAGKSTLFKILMGKVKPNSGSVRLFGTNPWKSPMPYARVGYVPEHDHLWDWMTGLEFIQMMGRMHGHDRLVAEKEARRVLDFVDLTDSLMKPIGTYSKGMRQRVKIAHALVNEPDLLLLDEPLQGCDPLARSSIMNVIRDLAGRGVTILITSHILAEIERITEQVIILHNGRVLALGDIGSIRSLLDQHPHIIDVHCDEPKRLGSEVLQLQGVRGVEVPSEGVLRVSTHDLGAVHDALPEGILGSGVRFSQIDDPGEDLDSILGYLVGAGG